MFEIVNRVLDKLTGADFWIALGFLAAGVICWLLMGTKTHEKKVRRKQIGIALLLGLVGGAAIWMNHSFLLREPVFSENVIGILVMRVVGDDALDSLQAALVENLNRELQEEAGEQWIEVHAGRDRLDDNNGQPAAHARARIIGQRLNAKLVIWGRKIGEKEFYPYITVTATPEHAGATVSWGGSGGQSWSNPFDDWSVKNERAAVVVQNMAGLHLPKELQDEPFYLIHFAAGYSYYVQMNYEEALVHFKAALRRKGGSPSELADLQFFTAVCELWLAFGQENMSANLQEAIGLCEKAAKVYEGQNETKWAMSQTNLGAAYSALPTGDRAANLQKAIAAYEAAQRVYTEKDFPPEWAAVQTGLGFTYGALPTGDHAANLQKAIATYEAAQRVYTEKDFPFQWAGVQTGLGFTYGALPTGDRAANLQKAIAAYEAAQRVYTEKDFPFYWAGVQNALGLGYSALPTRDRAANLQKAIAAYEAALRVRTEKDFPFYWAMSQNNLGNAYLSLPTGDHAANLQKAIATYEAAQRVYTEKDFPFEWAMSQNDLGLAYAALPTRDRAANLQKAIAAYEAALRVCTEKDLPFYWALVQNDLGYAYSDLPTGDRAANLRKAKVCLEAALKVYTESGFPEAHLAAAARLADVKRQLRNLTSE